MQKLILISILAASVAIPWRAARDESPRRGLMRAIRWMLVFNLLYLLAVMFVFPRL